MAGGFRGNCGLGGILGAGVFLTGCAVLSVTAFPVVQIAFGAVYMHECPAAPVIPVYLMVSGIWALIMMVLFALPKPRRGHTIWTVWICTSLLFIFIWLLLGSYQIYSIYPPNYDKNATASNGSKRSLHTSPAPQRDLLFAPENQSALKESWTIPNNRTWSSQMSREQLNVQQEDRTYCNRAVYTFAFWTTTLVHVLAGNILLMTTCLYGFMKCIDAFVKHLTT